MLWMQARLGPGAEAVSLFGSALQTICGMAGRYLVPVATGTKTAAYSWSSRNKARCVNCGDYVEARRALEPKP